MIRPLHNNSGFTLIELMVVTFILGLLAAIVMPRIVGETDHARYGQAYTEAHFWGRAETLQAR
jgi:general secretion pathway protein G